MPKTDPPVSDLSFIFSKNYPILHYFTYGNDFQIGRRLPDSFED